MAKSPTVSVVIPAYNEATYIDRLLEALCKQNFKDFEVIVSDAESKDGTEEVVADFKKKLDIRLVSSPPQGPAQGRNLGAARAKGEWLLFLDADVDIEDADFIKLLLGTTTENKWVTSTGRMTAHGKVAKQYEKLFKYQKMLSRTKRPVTSGYCIFTKRSIFKRVNGFNEKIHFGEDYEYVSRTGRDGKFGFVSNAYYFVDPRRNERDGLKLAYQGTLNEFYRLFFGYKKLEKKPINYQFGNHAKRQK